MVLVGSRDTVTVNITRAETNKIVETSQEPSCYNEAYGYDIEFDGSVGGIAVPGVLVVKSPAQCKPEIGELNSGKFTNCLSCNYYLD